MASLLSAASRSLTAASRRISVAGGGLHRAYLSTSVGSLDASTRSTLEGLKGHSLLRIDDYSPEELKAVLLVFVGAKAIAGKRGYLFAICLLLGPERGLTSDRASHM